MKCEQHHYQWYTNNSNNTNNAWTTIATGMHEVWPRWATHGVCETWTTITHGMHEAQTRATIPLTMREAQATQKMCKIQVAKTPLPMCGTWTITKETRKQHHHEW
jgi:hypothetical protein